MLVPAPKVLRTTNTEQDELQIVSTMSPDLSETRQSQFIGSLESHGGVECDVGNTAGAVSRGGLAQEVCVLVAIVSA